MQEGSSPSEMQGRRVSVAPKGAMTRAMSAFGRSDVRVLRIGVVEEGRVLEERVLDERANVRVGTAEKNDFLVHAPGFAARFALFQCVGDSYVLNFTDAMQGRVASALGAEQLHELRARGAARDAGTHWQIKLSDASRGKITIGKTTLLFQLVPKRPAQTRPQLPATVRGGFRKGIDWVYSAFVTASFVAHFGFVLYLESSDFRLSSDMSEVPDEVARMIFEAPEPPPVDEDTNTAPDPSTPAPTPQPRVTERERSRPSETHETNRPPTDNATADPNEEARLAENLAEQASQALIGALGNTVDSAVADVLAGGMVTGNAADVLADAAGVNTAAGPHDTLAIRNASHGSGEDRAIGTLAAARVGSEAREGDVPLTETAVRVSARLQDVEIGEIPEGFSPEAITRVIRQRIGAIRACYERGIRADSRLAGKVTVEFTVLTTGTFSQVEAVENTFSGPAAESAAECIRSTIARFRVMPPPPSPATVSYPFVFAPMQ